MATSSYLSRLVSEHPELIGRPLHLSPRALEYEIVCHLNADGTISAHGSETESESHENEIESFATPLELIRKLFEPNFKGAASTSDLFLEPGRKKSVRYFVQQAASSTAGASLNGPRQCVGFKLPAFNAYGETGLRTKVRIDILGEVLRSDNCCGSVRRNRRARMCSACATAKEVITSHLRGLREQRLLCHGVKRDKFEALIESRKWEGERADVSMACFVRNRLFALQCDGQKTEPNGSPRCRHCWKMLSSLRSMRWRDRRRKCNEENRLIYSSKRCLSALDRERKERILRLRREDKMRKLRAEVAKAERQYWSILLR